MSTNADALQYLFERPSEPIFKPKGKEGDVQIELPDSYYTDRYRPIISQITTRLTPAGTTIQVKQLDSIPDISLPMSLPRRANFSVLNDYHRNCATRLIEVFMAARTVEDFIATSAYCRDRVNPYMYNYANSVAILHRNDTRNMQLPSHAQLFPNLYMDKAIFFEAREELNIVPDGSRNPIDIPRDYTATDLDIEHRVAYWREDVGINLHHWHWHLVFPLSGPIELIRKDRRGELFYYMHQQMLARYNLERLCNQLNRVRSLSDFKEVIPEGYFPKLDSLVASRTWPSRPANTRLSDLNREHDQITVSIQTMERWRDRIFEAIQSGSYRLPTGESVRFPEREGIDILGNMLESNVLSPNINEYGNFHNMGHFLIGYSHDPDNRYLETFQVMGDPAVNMRDPIFHRFHAFINDIFESYKATLPGYTVQQLQFENVQVTGLQITSNGIPNNQIATFWQQAQMDLSRGLDFTDSTGSIYARFTHLQHAPLTYTINVRNNGAARMGTVRLYYAPKFDERGTPILFRYQKSLFIELDRFTFNLRNGNNTITRRSDTSSVTIPYEQTFRDLSVRPAEGTSSGESFAFCGCGWPQHMQFARGTSAGYPCELFVMISNNANDSVEGSSMATGCDDASSYCGVRGGRYPDRQAMGFPFDRMPRQGVTTLRNFLTPNMFVQDITIRYANRIVAPIQPSGTRRP